MPHEQLTTTSTASLPIIDLRDATSGTRATREATVAHLMNSLGEWGFLLLDGHGLPTGQVAAAFAASEAFFRLDEATKQACHVPESLGNRGYVGIGGETAVGARAADLKEFFHVGQPHPGGTSASLGNTWPDEAAVPGFRETMLALYAELETIAGRVLGLVEEGLDVEPGRLREWITGGNSILRLIHYPPLPDDHPTDAVRAAAHADINLITLLCEGTSGGLEVQRPDGSWMPVTSLEDQLVVNVGDMLALATEGRVRSTPHRVVNPQGSQRRQARFSMPFFVHPRSEVVLAAGTTGPITAGAFLDERLRTIRS